MEHYRLPAAATPLPAISHRLLAADADVVTDIEEGLPVEPDVITI